MRVSLLATLTLAAGWLLGGGRAAAELIAFDYLQTSATEGSGTLSGVVNGISYFAPMPLATVTQNDVTAGTVAEPLPFPEEYVGYLDGADNPSTNGNDFGVHIGWDGATVTLTGERIISDTEVEVYELDVPLMIAADGSPGGGWTYAADMTDDDGAGNDAIGTGMRLAGWVGESTMGHRHSQGITLNLNVGVDSYHIDQAHNAVDENGRGDQLGIAISYRDGTFDVGSGLMYADNIGFTGSLFVDGSTNPENFLGTALLADLDQNETVDLDDFAVLRENFFRTDATSRLEGDLNLDQSIDLHDFALFRNAYHASQAAAVPEPSTAALAAAAACAAVLLRRRRN